MRNACVDATAHGAARHRARHARLLLPPTCLSLCRALYSSPSSPLSPPSTTVDATTAASTPPSSFLLSTPSPFLFTSLPLPAFSSLFFIFAAIVTSPPSPPSPSSTSITSHHRDPPSLLLHLPSFVPISDRASLHFVPHRRPPPSASPTSPVSLPPLSQPSIAASPPPPLAPHHRHPLRLVAERHRRSLPCSSAPTTITTAASALSSFSAFSLHFALHPGEAISVFIHRHGLLHC